MFELNQKVKLKDVNARAEMHGDERKPAFDLTFEAACSNDILIHFHPELRSMLFKKNDSPDLVGQLDPEALTELRFTKLQSTLAYEWEGIGYSIVIPYGIGGPSDIRLGEVKLGKFKITPQNGGTVIVEFKAICHPETEDVGRLCEFIQREIDITVTPPEPSTLGELFGEEKQAA